MPENLYVSSLRLGFYQVFSFFMNLEAITVVLIYRQPAALQRGYIAAMAAIIGAAGEEVAGCSKRCCQGLLQ